ncbi:hypothetical protein [Streptomyces sp. NPDC048638]|uniref:hypothetical protein n=1 Tax=Streptomyces sp. NPDC048638 TaxID=3365580 RepID=UPI00371D749C
MPLTMGRTRPRSLAALGLILGLLLGAVQPRTGAGHDPAPGSATGVQMQPLAHTQNLMADGGKKKRKRKPTPSGRSMTQIDGDWYRDPIGHRSFVFRQAVWGHRSQLEGGKDGRRIDGQRNVAIGFVDITGLEDVDTRGLEVVDTATLKHRDPALYQRLRMDERPEVKKFVVVPSANDASAGTDGAHSELRILIWDLAFLSQDLRNPVASERLFALYTDRSPCKPQCAGRIPATTDVLYGVVDGKGSVDELNSLIDGAKAKAAAEEATVARKVAAQKKLIAERKAAEKQRRQQTRKDNQFFRNARAAKPCDGQALGARSPLTTVAALSASRSALRAAGPCGEDDAAEDAAGGTAGGLAQALTQPVPQAPGGIDFSSLQLRYLSDPGDGSGLQYSFQAPLSTTGGSSPATGLNAAKGTSQAFFVWLALNPSSFWVNLNPNEPDRIVDPQLGRTDAGRIMLEADLRMKKTVGKLIHPDSALGRRFWAGVSGNCLSFRNWILPAPATVREDGDKLYIIDAPLDVRMETQYLAQRGKSAARSCPQQDKATEDRNEQLYRSLVLPELKHAINTAPEYAAVRRVYLARVAAEWYRNLSRTRHTTYGDLIDKGDIQNWRTTSTWKPTDTFQKYVDSYKKGEFHVTHKTTSGNNVYLRTYVYGGVDLTRVPFDKLSDDRFRKKDAGLSKNVDSSLTTPAAGGGDNAILLGAPTPLQASGGGTSQDTLSASGLALRLLPLLILPAGAVLWWRRRRLNSVTATSPLRRAAVTSSSTRHDPRSPR